MLMHRRLFVSAAFLGILVSASQLRVERSLQGCGRLDSCRLVDTNDQSNQTPLEPGSTPLVFDAKDRSYTVYCTTTGPGNVNFVKFSSEGSSRTEYSGPWTFGGDNGDSVSHFR